MGADGLPAFFFFFFAFFETEVVNNVYQKIHIKSTFIKATTFSSGFSNLSVGSITDGSNNVLVILRERGGHECHTNYYHYYILQLLCTLGNSSICTVSMFLSIRCTHSKSKFVNTHHRTLLVSLQNTMYIK